MIIHEKDVTLHLGVYGSFIYLKTTRNMRIGIIGAGWIARKMALSLQAKPQDCEVYAIASRSIEKAVAFAQQWSVKKAYGSYEQIVDDENVDLVYIATPHSHHYEHTLCIMK